MPEVLRHAVVGGTALVAPRPVFDPATAVAVAAERADAAAEGYARGVADGRAAAREELGGALAGVQAAIDRLHHELVDQRTAATAVDLTLVTAVVDAVLDAAPPASAEVLLGRLRDAAATLDDDTLTVTLHPEDRSALDGAALDHRLVLRDDPRVERGEATVAGEWGHADLTRAALRDAALALLTAGDGEVPR